MQAKYRFVSATAVIQVEFPVYALCMHMSYKMAKFDKQPFPQKLFFFFMTPLHAHTQYICIVYTRYQKASVKALVQVDFPMYALSKHKQNMQTGKNSSVHKAVILSKIIFWHQTSSCKCSVCLQYVGKVSDGFSKSSGTSWFPHTCTMWALTNPY